MEVRNLTRNVSLGDRVDVADTSTKRRRGLLKHSALHSGEGLWIAPCEGVHTFGMNFEIDVLFLSKKKQVVKIRRAMPKRRLAFCLLAHSVLELPAGVVDATGTKPGDQLELKR